MVKKFLNKLFRRYPQKNFKYNFYMEDTRGVIHRNVQTGDSVTINKYPYGETVATLYFRDYNEIFVVFNPEAVARSKEGGLH